jgi:hypothetical protein
VRRDDHPTGANKATQIPQILNVLHGNNVVSVRRTPSLLRVSATSSKSNKYRHTNHPQRKQSSFHRFDNQKEKTKTRAILRQRACD